jgi:hypothetical protein
MEPFWNSKRAGRNASEPHLPIGFATGIGPEALFQAAKFAEAIAVPPNAVNIALY